MADDSDWWGRTFAAEQRADSLELRVQRLEASLKDEQQRSGDARKRASAIIERVERTKRALEYAVVAATVPIAVLAIEAISRRYTGWDAAFMWIGIGFLMVMITRDLGRRINSI